MVDITKSIDPWRVLAECASGAKAVVAMDSFRAWKAPVAPGEKPSPLEMSPEYGADGAGMCWSLKNQKKNMGRYSKNILEISATFSLAYGSRRGTLLHRQDI